MDVLNLKGRAERTIDANIANNSVDLNTFVSESFTMFISGASSIGKAVGNYAFLNNLYMINLHKFATKWQ